MGKKTRRGYLSQFPAHWKVYRMDKLLNRVKKKVDVKKTENYTQIGIRSHGKGIFYKEAVTGKELGNKSVFWVAPNCFVVNIVFAWEMAVAKTTQNDVGLIASHRFPMYKPKPELLDLDFLLYYFKMPLGKYLLGLASPGGAGRNKTLGQKEFAELEICIPPVNEQKEIVSILKTWDKAIDLKEKLIEEKKLQKTGVLRQLLSGKQRLDGFSEYWKKYKLSDISQKMNSGGTPKSTNNNFYEGNIPFVKINDITNSSKYLFSTETKISLEGLNSSSAWLVPPNSIIYSMYASVGFLSINKCEVATSQAIMGIIPKKEVSVEYLYYYLLDYKRKIHSLIEKGTQGNLNAALVKGFEIIVPPIQEQKAIAEILSSADQEIFTLESDLKETLEQKRGLMQQLLTGKKQVVV